MIAKLELQTKEFTVISIFWTNTIEMNVPKWKLIDIASKAPKVSIKIQLLVLDDANKF